VATTRELNLLAGDGGGSVTDEVSASLAPNATARSLVALDFGLSAASSGVDKTAAAAAVVSIEEATDIAVTGGECSVAGREEESALDIGCDCGSIAAVVVDDTTGERVKAVAGSPPLSADDVERSAGCDAGAMVMGATLVVAAPATVTGAAVTEGAAARRRESAGLAASGNTCAIVE
jgi:hypothetical protein